MLGDLENSFTYVFSLFSGTYLELLTQQIKMC